MIAATASTTPACVMVAPLHAFRCPTARKGEYLYVRVVVKRGRIALVTFGQVA